jgi:drug/metabolite transporter (DMT)-like permease
MFDAVTKNWPLIAVFLSGLGFSIQTFIIKKLGEHGYHEVFVAVFFRGLVQCLVSIYYVQIGWSTPPGEAKVALFGESRRLHFILAARAVIGSLGIIFSFLAVDHLPLADAICLVMLSPLIASVLSYYFLGEPWRLVERVACLISISGMVFVVKPSFIFGSDTALPAIGVVFGLISACSAGTAFVLVRVLGTVAIMPWETICLTQSLGQMILALPFTYLFKEHFVLPTVPWMFWLLILGSIVGTISQILMTIGMQREKSAAAGAMRMSDILFGFIWQAVATADNVSVLSIIGAIMIFISVCIIVISKEKIAPVDGTMHAYVSSAEDGSELESLSQSQPLSDGADFELAGGEGGGAVRISQSLIKH